MDDIPAIWAGAAFFWLFMMILGAFIAKEKNRAAEEGFMLALLFGPFGVLVEALLPTIQPPVVTPPAPMIADEMEASEELAEQRRKAAKRAQDLWREQARIDREAAERRAEERAERVREFWVAVGAWFRRQFVEWEWYKGLPEVMQPIVVGLAVAGPVIIVLAILWGR